MIGSWNTASVPVRNMPTQIVPAVMNYLGIDPDSKKTEDLKKAAEYFKKIRPASS